MNISSTPVQQPYIRSTKHKYHECTGTVQLEILDHMDTLECLITLFF